ncbi:MAG: lysophospholipid acyltransferase family protein [Chloroherpetonaceae bacterium]|nr:lysophospholipid acyltransferase family protein [Chloroherpetonaceae bacterium]MCS7211342.1 lysophospholipid acyltransferase family protein [Chloroherpetonaceae bacterium]MDW8020390.1 lysophospholipid acyltransferase family protein [Chloroherpetonaceae bacterium]MDW8465895.1 lysophospholipid acyltransferase family protein [Chloroherpetonaceae bacterium]
MSYTIPPFFKSLADRVTDGLIASLACIVQRLSQQQLYALAAWIGQLLDRRIKLRRSLIEENLRYAFPEKSEPELQQLVRQIYLEQAIYFLEILRLPLVRTRQDAEALFEIDASLIESRCFSQGRGGIVVSAHFGNWELMAVCWALCVRPIAIVYKPLSNRWLNARLNQWRTACGNELISMQDAARLGLRRLREGKLLALLSDQSGHSDGFYLPFLGRPASVFLGAAVFALRTGLPLLLAMPIRTALGKYRIEFSEIPTSDLSYSTESIHQLAQRYTEAIERYIRRYPAQWFWLHNRWKHIPPAATQPLHTDLSHSAL